MHLCIIGPEKGKPQNIGLARSAAEQLQVLRRSHSEPLVIHRDRKLDRGWDALAERVMSHQLRAYAMENNWYRVDRTQAVTAFELAMRKLAQKPNGESPDYGALMRYIREQVLGTTQEVIGAIASVTTSTVSRWESGQLVPGTEELHRLRQFIVTHELPWDDRWLHEPPE
jgi:DNA-binding transcriptional regulator YiaG